MGSATHSLCDPVASDLSEASSPHPIISCHNIYEMGRPKANGP